MNAQYQSLFDSALELPEPERAELASRLIETLSPELEDPFDAEWEHELNRRSREVEEGAPTVTWAEVKQRRENSDGTCGN